MDSTKLKFTRENISNKIPSYVYSLSNIQIGKTYLLQIQTNISRFVRVSNHDRVKQSTVTADYDNAGQRMPDVKCTNMSLRLPLLGRILVLPNLKLKSYG